MICSCSLHAVGKKLAGIIAKSGSSVAEKFIIAVSSHLAMAEISCDGPMDVLNIICDCRAIQIVIVDKGKLSHSHAM
jgi:hypothetical protein